MIQCGLRHLVIVNILEGEDDHPVCDAHKDLLARVNGTKQIIRELCGKELTKEQMDHLEEYNVLHWDNYLINWETCYLNLPGA